MTEGSKQRGDDKGYDRRADRGGEEGEGGGGGRRKKEDEDKVRTASAKIILTTSHSGSGNVGNCKNNGPKKLPSEHCRKFGADFNFTVTGSMI